MSSLAPQPAPRVKWWPGAGRGLLTSERVRSGGGAVSLDVWLRGAGVFALLTALAVFFTWPVASAMSSQIVWQIDPPFSVWRLAWVAHQIVADPRHLFDGNIFFPEPRTLAYSDAMLVEGLIATPLIKAGLAPLLVMNLMLIGGLVCSGAGMYVLARRLSGNTAAAILAAVIFSFAPYRADHLMHLELQWAPWIPLTLWAFHRTLSDGRLRDGVLTGVFLVLQLLSSIYYALFLSTALAIAGGMSLILWRSWIRPRAVAGLAIGAVLTVAVAVPYSQPYRANIKALGLRTSTEITSYSATPASYLSVTPGHILFGPWSGHWSELEMRLFPGAVAILLLALAFVPPVRPTSVRPTSVRPTSARPTSVGPASVSPASGGPASSGPASSGPASVGPTSVGPTQVSGVRWLYLVVLAFAVEGSFGLNGRIYPFLHAWLTPFQGLRAPGRFGILVLLAVAVLAAFGAANLLRATSASWRRPLAILLGGLMMIEYQVAPAYMEPLPVETPSVYQWLAREPRGTVTVEFPMPDPNGMPFMDPFYMYFATMHWQPLVNGYSGHDPPSYVQLLGELQTFPDEASMAALRARGVKAIILHGALYDKAEDYKRTVIGLEAFQDVQLMGTWKDHRGEARAYRLTRGAR